MLLPSLPFKYMQIRPRSDFVAERYPKAPLGYWGSAGKALAAPRPSPQASFPPRPHFTVRGTVFASSPIES